MKNVRKMLALALALALLCAALPPALAAEGAAYADVPADSWAASYIEKAKEYGLMQGLSADRFGYGRTLSNAETAQLLCNVLGWEPAQPETPTYVDVTPDQWYYGAVEAVYGGDPAGSYFYPNAPITREKIAGTFVRALGLEGAAVVEEHLPVVFSDVTGQQGYINVAASIGLMQGTGNGQFRPDATLKREEAAAILVRFYEKYRAETDFLHGFYAISAYSQRDLAAKMDAVTYQWSTMLPDGTLDTASGDCRVPDSYESIVNYLADAPVRTHLGVYMAAGAETLLMDPAARETAVSAIVSELERTYERTGANPYDGVTIDFEGLRGEQVRAGFSAFVTALAEKLHGAGKTLYVAAQPAVWRSTYFDGFDFRALGRAADKVILMAHDYAPLTMAGMQSTTWYEKGALTPIGQVYYSLKTALDPERGVEDPGKLVLALSMDAQGWEIDENDKLVSETPVSIGIQHLYDVLAAGAEKQGYAEYDQNPWVIYRAADGTRLFAWYEDAESVRAKISLAKCFGVTGISVWRLGNIPADAACRQALGLAG